MSKRGIVIAIAVAAILLLGFVGYKLIIPGEYVPAEDEIALRIIGHERRYWIVGV